MSTFESRLYALCLEGIEEAMGAEAQTALTHIVAAALATTIAAQTKGDPVASTTIATVVAEGLPGMVAKRAHLFRHPMQGRPQ